MSFVDYSEDFIAYDAYHNHRRSRSPDKPDDNHWRPVGFGDKCDVYANIAPKIVRMYENGVDIKTIMEKLGVRSVKCIYYWLDKYKVGRRRGRYNARGRLSPEELEKIRKMYLEGKSVYAIAKELGRPPSTINYALKRMGLK